MEEPLCAGSTLYNAPLRKTLVLTDAQCHLSSKTDREVKTEQWHSHMLPCHPKHCSKSDPGEPGLVKQPSDAIVLAKPP